MRNPIKDEFNGTWRFVNQKEAEGFNYLHFSKGNRIVQFYNIVNGKFDAGRMMVGDIGSSKIEFYPQDGSQGWTRGYRFDHGNLVIVEGADEYPCERLPEMPQWLIEGIAQSDKFFDENESSWGQKKE